MVDVAIGKEIRTAIKQGDVERVVALIGSDKSRLEMMTPFGTWLHVAASMGQLEIAKRLVALGADVNRNGGIYGAAPIKEAASEGHVALVKFLIDSGAELDVSKSERNPLFGAIHHGHVDIVRLLIAVGIDANVRYNSATMKEMDAVAFAKEWGQDEIVKLLEKKGSSPRSARVKQPRRKSQANVRHDPESEIVSYFENALGLVQPLALREILPSDSPVSIHVIPASGDRKSLTLFTSGMSSHEMDVPAGSEAYRWAELAIHLPGDWPLSPAAIANPDHFWPIEWLKQIAYYPQENDTWLGGPITVLANDDPPEPFAPHVGFAAMLLLAGFGDVGPIELSDGRSVQVYTLLPLYPEEYRLERSKGIAPLLELFQRQRISGVVKLNRPNVGLSTPVRATRKKKEKKK